MVWQAHSLLCPQELNQGISSLDSFPFSHNNFRSHPSPFARILRALSDQRLSSRPGSGSFVPLQRTSLLEAPFPSLATGPLFRTRVKRKGEWGWGDSLCPTASNGAAGDRQKRANGGGAWEQRGRWTEFQRENALEAQRALWPTSTARPRLLPHL